MNLSKIVEERQQNILQQGLQQGRQAGRLEERRVCCRKLAHAQIWQD